MLFSYSEYTYFCASGKSYFYVAFMVRFIFFHSIWRRVFHGAELLCKESAVNTQSHWFASHRGLWGTLRTTTWPVILYRWNKHRINSIQVLKLLIYKGHTHTRATLTGQDRLIFFNSNDHFSKETIIAPRSNVYLLDLIKFLIGHFLHLHFFTNYKKNYFYPTIYMVFIHVGDLANQQIL